jgi:predicted membrane protein
LATAGLAVVVFFAAAVFGAGFFTAPVFAVGFFAAVLADAALVVDVVFLVAIDPCVEVERHIVTLRGP